MSEKVIVTEEILDMNPDLVDQGVQIGEEIELGPLCNEDGTPLKEGDQNADGPGGTDPTKPRGKYP